jgi:hypothetical protein
MAKYADTFYRLSTRAFLRGKDDIVYTGEQLMLALLLHAKGNGRGSEDETFVRKIMKDHNLDTPAK